MHVMAQVAARLGRLERAEAENDKLWRFVEDVAGAYDLADIEDVIERARKMRDER